MGFISIPINEKAENILKRAEDLAKKKGVKFEHDEKSGSFSYLVVSGTFKISKESIEIEYSKPPFVADSMVEAEIKQFFTA